MLALTAKQILPALKLTWVALLLAGVLANLTTLRDAWIDFRFVKRFRRDKAAQIQAWLSLREQIVSMTFQAGVLYLRGWALRWPDPGNDRFTRDWAVEATVLTALQLLLAYNCVLDNRDRRRTIRLLRPFVSADALLPDPRRVPPERK